MRSLALPMRLHDAAPMSEACFAYDNGPRVPRSACSRAGSIPVVLSEPIEHCSLVSTPYRHYTRGACCEGGWGGLASVWHHSTWRPICSLVHPPADDSYARCQPCSSRR